MQAEILRVDLDELRLLLGFAGEDLHDAITAQGLFGLPRHVSHRVLDPRAVAPERPAHDADEQRDHRADHGDQQRQAKVEVDHHAEHAEHEQAVANDNGHGVGNGFGDLLRVEGELRDQRAGGTAGRGT